MVDLRIGAWLTLTCWRASSGLNCATESSCWSAQALTASLASRYCFHNLTASWYRLHRSRRDWQVSFHAVTASCTAASIFWLTSESHEEVNGSAAALNSSRRSSLWSKDPYKPCKINQWEKWMFHLPYVGYRLFCARTNVFVAWKKAWMNGLAFCLYSVPNQVMTSFVSIN